MFSCPDLLERARDLSMVNFNKSDTFCLLVWTLKIKDHNMVPTIQRMPVINYKLGKELCQDWKLCWLCLCEQAVIEKKSGWRGFSAFQIHNIFMSEPQIYGIIKIISHILKILLHFSCLQFALCFLQCIIPYVFFTGPAVEYEQPVYGFNESRKTTLAPGTKLHVWQPSWAWTGFFTCFSRMYIRTFPFAHRGAGDELREWAPYAIRTGFSLLKWSFLWASDGQQAQQNLQAHGVDNRYPVKT